MIHRLLETLRAFLQHLSVDVDDVDARLAVRVHFARIVKDPQRDVARPTGDVDAVYGAPSIRDAGERRKSPSRGGARRATWRRS